MDISLLRQRDYRLAIKTCVEQRARDGQDISFSSLASAARIQRTFLSQVINRKHHLNNDQLYAVCQVLGLGPALRQHLILLSEWERCRLERRKSELEGQLARLEERLQGGDPSALPKPLAPDALDDYFADPHGEIVHRFLTIPSYRAEPERIRARLGLAPARWQEILVTLRDCGFISFDASGITLLQDPSYPQEGSPAEQLRTIQGRLRVAHQKLKQRDIDEFNYNWSLLANPARKKAMKIEYLHLLREIYEASLQTAHEDVYQLTIDLLSP